MTIMTDCGHFERYLPTYPLVIWEILGAIQGREICQHTVVAEVH